jgi:hypothetical protein
MDHGPHVFGTLYWKVEQKDFHMILGAKFELEFGTNVGRRPGYIYTL